MLTAGDIGLTRLPNSHNHAAAESINVEHNISTLTIPIQVNFEFDQTKKQHVPNLLI